MTQKCPKPLDLVTYFLEGSSEGGGLGEHVRSCPSCQTQIQELEAERKAFLVRHPFSSFWHSIEERTSRRPSALSRFWKSLISANGLRAAAATASVAVFMIIVLGRFGQTPTRSPDILTKGGVGIDFYVASTDGNPPTRGKSGMSLPTGSALQFVYSTSAPDNQLLLVGVEADGTLTVYHPFNGSSSVSVKLGNRVNLSQALSWQPQSAYERFYAIFSKEPVQVEDVRKALKDLTSSGKTVEQTSKLPLSYPQASVILYRK